jgi:hypothetical protein
MDDLLGVISHDIQLLGINSSTHSRRRIAFKPYMSPAQAAELDASMLDASLSQFPELVPIVEYIEVISSIYSRCNVHGHDAEEAAKALHCMLQLVSGLRKAWSNASTNEDPHTILTFFNESVTSNVDLANVDLIATLTRHTGLGSEIQALDRLISTAHQDLKRISLDTRQRETIRSERSMFTTTTRKKKKTKKRETQQREWTPAVVEVSSTLEMNMAPTMTMTVILNNP